MSSEDTLSSVRLNLRACSYAIGVTLLVSACAGAAGESNGNHLAPPPSPSAPTSLAPTTIEPGVSRPTEKSLPAKWPSSVPPPPGLRFVGASSNTPLVAIWTGAREVTEVSKSVDKAFRSAGFEIQPVGTPTAESPTIWIKGKLKVRVAITQSPDGTYVSQTVGPQ